SNSASGSSMVKSLVGGGSFNGGREKVNDRFSGCDGAGSGEVGAVVDAGRLGPGKMCRQREHFSIGFGPVRRDSSSWKRVAQYGHWMIIGSLGS
ncbi:MAG TPA: hypothetical protein VL403_03745, partial [Candidatus Kryptonia bacterium]|nr:hypothetical protein [Candidatus Kryptonia bacterium]